VRLRTGFVVLLALVCGGSAAYFLNALLSNRPPAAPPETVPVVVAAADAAPFATLTADQLKTWECHKDSVPAGALARPEEVVGRVTLTQLVKGEPILEAKLAPRGAGRGIAPGNPEGMQAFTIQTPTVSPHAAGFILPGNKVDVLTFSTDRRESATVTLVQNVKVLAVDRRPDAQSLCPVTLCVTPTQAARLEWGQSKGTLYLSLRNPDGKLAEAGAVPGLANDIEEGKRTFTIQTPNVAPNVAGFILPGNKVDVLLTDDQNGNDAVSVPLVENVKILAVDRPAAATTAEFDVKEFRSVTLQVTDDEAGLLGRWPGPSRFTLHLALRRPDDSPVQIRTFRGTRDGAAHVYPAR
jgi:pilus assembly protein CpaB